MSAVADCDHIQWLRELAADEALEQVRPTFLAIADELERGRGMGLAEFVAAIRILQTIPREELVAAGAIAEDDGRAWQEFRSNPARYVIRASAETAAAVWRVIHDRRDAA